MRWTGWWRRSWPRGIDGLIVSNTTTSAPRDLRDAGKAREAGGLSGRPLFLRATQVLAQASLRVEGRVPLIGVGGVDSAQSAIAKIRAGPRASSSSILRWSMPARVSWARSSAVLPSICAKPAAPAWQSSPDVMQAADRPGSADRVASEIDRAAAWMRREPFFSSAHLGTISSPDLARLAVRPARLMRKREEGERHAR